jgi:hypothetical protein
MAKKDALDGEKVSKRKAALKVRCLRRTLYLFFVTSFAITSLFFDNF